MQLYFEGSWLLNLNFKSFAAGNQLQVKKSNSKPLLTTIFSNFPSGNQLHCLVIDYQSLGWLWNPLLWGKAWSWRNLEARLCLLKQSCINLEVVLILWSGLVWFFFGIIKIMYTCSHILPLFDDDNQVISFRHHQNMHDS